MTTTLRILIVCFCGALIGGLVGLQLHYPLIGLAVGSLIGYLANDLGTVQAAAVRTYWMVKRDYKAELKGRHPALRQKASVRFAIFRSLLRSYVNCTGTFFILIASLVVILFAPDGLDAVVQRFNTVHLLHLAFASAYLGFIATGFYCTDEGRFSAVKSIPNPAICIIAGVRIMLTVVRSAIREMVRLALCILKGVKAYFIMIHSDLRLLCACNIALGTSVGYYFGNALIGAVAGGVLGAVNYQLITVRLLKLVPAQRP